MEPRVAHVAPTERIRLAVVPEKCPDALAALQPYDASLHPTIMAQSAEDCLRWLAPPLLASSVNTMADPVRIRLTGKAPLLHFVKLQDMGAWPLTAAQSR